MKQLLKILIIGMLCCSQITKAQQSSGDVIIGKVFAKSDGPLIGVNIKEIDPTNRIMSVAITDVNGNFSIKTKSSKNKLQLSYIGYTTITLAIGDKRKFSVEMEETNKIKEVIVTARKMSSTGALNIPTRE